MLRRKENRVSWGLLVATAVIAGIGAIFYSGTKQLISDAEQLDQTHAVINTLSQLYTNIQDVRIATRGYVAHYDERFLKHYRSAREDARDSLDALHALLTNYSHENESEHLETLEKLFDDRVKSSEELIRLRREQGLIPAIVVVRQQLEEELNDDLRTTINHMIEHQRDDLARRSSSAEDSSRSMLVVLAVGSMAEICLAIAATLAIRRHMRGRRKAVEDLQRNEEELRRHHKDLLSAKNAIEQQATVLASNSQQLETARVSADAANHAKSTFLANMSHEIRTPLTAILGYAELLLEPDQSPSDRHDCLQVIRRSARHLLELINDILDLSKIEAGRMTIESIPTNPAQLVAECVSMVRPRAEEKKVALKLEFDGPLPDKINTDPLRLRQILMNLLGNAVKFTSDGDVIVRARCDRDPVTNAGTLTVQVVDTGIGMTRDQLDRIFKPFTQADETTTRRFGGTGLGLAISKRLTEMLGGSISVESDPGCGSQFTITVAAGDLATAHWIHGLTEQTFSESAEKPPPSGETALRGRILLAEDGRDNQRLIATHLRRAGAHVTVADTGSAAIKLLKNQTFDLVLMDMQMPELDGYDATRMIRSQGLDVPVIALTAHAMAGDRAKCMSAGCTDYLTKPIDKAQLLWTVASYLPASQAALVGATLVSPSAAAESADRGASIKSDFADDPQMRDLVNDFVRELPEQVTRLHKLLQEQQLDELRRAVHQLKGAGGGYGFAPITAEAARVEQIIKANRDLAELQQAVAALVELVQRVEGFPADKLTTEKLPAVNLVET